MLGWIFATLWISLDSSAVQPTAFKHVRSTEPRVRSQIAEGYARSLTLRVLIDTIEELSCVVYIRTDITLTGGMRGALLLPPVGAREMPVLRVVLKAGLAHDEAIAVIGHELQHVVEVVGEAPAADGVDWTAARDRFYPAGWTTTGARKYETALAVRVTAKILGELRRARRQRAAGP